MNIPKYFVVAACCLGSAILSVPVARAQAPAKNAAGDFRFDAPIVKARSNGFRLEGNAAHPATIRSPQLNVTAPLIAFDFAGSAITQVRAQNGVQFKLNLANATGDVRIEAQSQSVTLDAVPRDGRRTLTLTGNISGFYEANGQRNTLGGNKATISYGSQAARDLMADIENPRLELSGQSLAGNGATNNAPTTVVITATRALLDQKSGNARFVGNARAISNDGPAKFNVSAAEFVVDLSDPSAKPADGRQSINGLKTTGRTKIVVDLPPAPANANGAAQSTLRPTHMEIAADNALVSLASRTLTLSEKVSGFYRVPQAGSAPLDYQFSGERAVAKFVEDKDATTENPAGLNLDVSGVPVSIQVPGFNLGLGN